MGAVPGGGFTRVFIVQKMIQEFINCEELEKYTSLDEAVTFEPAVLAAVLMLRKHTAAAQTPGTAAGSADDTTR